ncbi:MAG: M3 family metallopeptidase [Hyphomicrobiaceae bacterium]
MPKADAANPLLATWTGPYEIPPFGHIAPEHFGPAFEVALARHTAEIARIASATSKPTFKNTIEALERSGRLLRRIGAVFWNLAGSHTSDALQATEREIAPRMAAHRNAITSNAALFARIDDLFERRNRLKLTPEQRRVLERTHVSFVRAGAKLSESEKKRMGEITQRLATLGTQFSQNVLADEKAFELPLPDPEDRAGLPDFLVAAAAGAARARKSAASHVITLSRSLIEPFLTFSSRRDLREQAFKAWIKRGENGGSTDNRAIVAETLKLREERARLLGYDTFAAFKLDDSMAKTPDAVRDLLETVWTPARERALGERDKLQAFAAGEGANITIEPWDWRYYAEKVRTAEYALEESRIKPYLQLDNMIAAAFATAERLFGLRFCEVHGLPLYHPDARAFEVMDSDGRHVGLFLGDYFARPSKRSGAWMSGFRGQEKLSGDIRPIIVNVCNFAKAEEGKPTLLSMDDAHTLFHEFGHALHGLLSDVTYPSIAGTAVARDFVELPSQLLEHWLMTPQILGEFARHYETGEPMPPALIEQIRAARTFNQGFATIEFLASAIVDIDFHAAPASGDPMQREANTLARIGLPREIVMRHRTPHFAHVFSGDGYSSGYYSYMWSEVLDADAFAAFEETGDVFDAETSEKLRRFIYGAGGSRDETEAYIGFRGKLPSVDGLLRKRGLAA